MFLRWWIANATVRDNILFGRSFNESWYARVVHACALEHDLKEFPAGDMTEIGAKGMIVCVVVVCVFCYCVTKTTTQHNKRYTQHKQQYTTQRTINNTHNTSIQHNNNNTHNTQYTIHNTQYTIHKRYEQQNNNK